MSLKPGPKESQIQQGNLIRQRDNKKHREILINQKPVNPRK